MGKTKQKKVCDLEASVVDKEKNCVRFFVKSSINENYVDMDIIWEIIIGLTEQYPALNFTGKWDFESTEQRKREYLFFFT